MRASTLCRSAAILAAVTLLSTGAIAGKKKKKKKKKVDDDIVDVSGVKSTFLLYTDGDNGYFATIRMDMDNLYWSADGKTFYKQRAFSGGANGMSDYSFRMWAPRVNNVADLDIKSDKGTMSCGEESWELTQVDPADATKIIDKATWKGIVWKRQGHQLSRDDKGTYYFVDRLRDEYGGKGFRLFAGQKGALKELNLTNIVSDSVGEIFSSKKGELRYVTENGTVSWIKGSKKTSLTNVPIEDNLSMVYGDLGVYEGSLGTPCDEY